MGASTAFHGGRRVNRKEHRPLAKQSPKMQSVEKKFITIICASIFFFSKKNLKLLVTRYRNSIDDSISFRMNENRWYIMRSFLEMDGEADRLGAVKKKKKREDSA